MKKKHLVWRILAFLLPLIAIYVLFSQILLISVVQSESMEPNFTVGSTIIFNRLAYKNKDPERGDIVIFLRPESGKYLAKRVIGIPGDHISFSQGYVLINDQYYDESDYLPPNVKTYASNDFTVPKSSYFLLGDNRSYSLDSRDWENPYISADDIYGKCLFSYNFSFQKLFK